MSGLQNVDRLVNSLDRRGCTKNKYPIVLVPGFAGFGDPIFGSINYWGGFEDLASELQAYTEVPIILPRIGPISSNWERACELYSQLRSIQSGGQGTGFDTPSTSDQTVISVDYGQYINLPPGTPRSTKTAVILGAAALESTWQWDANHPVHMICHSQGGNTARLLIELLSGRHGARHAAYFGLDLKPRQNYIKGVVTLGTPFLGTTFTDVIFNDILRDVQVDEVISRLVVSASRKPANFVDLQLKHWGFYPRDEENFRGMHRRLKDDILQWWNSTNNGIRDNGTAGVARLNDDFDPKATESPVYFFTMSFDATRPFPRLELTGSELAAVPTNPWKTLGGILYPGLGNVTAEFLSGVLSLGHSVSNLIPGNPSDVDYARWVVSIINSQARILGYQIRLPSPGGRIPRHDMLPALAVFSLGMSGVTAPFGPSMENDGVVDTVSMRGPADARKNPIYNSGRFNTGDILSNRGKYWDFGVTEGVDHADQVGVFTVEATYIQVLQLYKKLGVLVSFLE